MQSKNAQDLSVVHASLYCSSFLAQLYRISAKHPGQMQVFLRCNLDPDYTEPWSCVFPRLTLFPLKLTTRESSSMANVVISHLLEDPSSKFPGTKSRVKVSTAADLGKNTLKNLFSIRIQILGGSPSPRISDLERLPLIEIPRLYLFRFFI